jgi:hypothetical protein
MLMNAENAAENQSLLISDQRLSAVRFVFLDYRLPAISCYSTVTDLARLRGWSTSHPRRTAM